MTKQEIILGRLKNINDLIHQTLTMHVGMEDGTRSVFHSIRDEITEIAKLLPEKLEDNMGLPVSCFCNMTMSEAIKIIDAFNKACAEHHAQMKEAKFGEYHGVDVDKVLDAVQKANVDVTKLPGALLMPEGMQEMEDAKAKRTCPTCKSHIIITEEDRGPGSTWTEVGIAELSITGVCEHCWYETFKEDEADRDEDEDDFDPDEPAF